jgi:hypothetical protein
LFSAGFTAVTAHFAVLRPETIVSDRLESDLLKCEVRRSAEPLRSGRRGLRKS